MSDGKVVIDIQSNAKEFVKEFDSVNKSLDKTKEVMKTSKTAYSAYEGAIHQNTQALREMALAGGQNSAQFRKVAEETRQYKKALEDANASVDKAIGGGNKLAGSIKNLVLGYATFQGAVMALRGVMSSVEAFRTQEIAINQLNIALSNAGVYSDEYSAHIQRLASEIQSYSNYGDEAIIKAQAIGQAFIGQTRITDDLTKAVIDFASATGMDLEQAFNLVGKSIGSNTNALARYGIQLEKGMSDSQKMDAITKQLGDRYAGTAQATANATIQLKNAFGDMQEAIGRSFNPAMTSAQNSLINLMKTISGSVNMLGKLQTAWYSWKQSVNQRYADIAQKSGMKSEYEYYSNEVKKYQSKIDSLSGKTALKVSNKKPFKMTDDVITPTSTVSSGKSSSKVKQMSDAYEKLQQDAQKARREVELVALKYGTSSQETAKAFEKYTQINTKLSDISKIFEPEKVEQVKTAYEQLQQRISSLKTELQDLGAKGLIDSEQFAKLKNEYLTASEQLRNIDKSLTEEMGKDWDNVSKSISSTLSSGLISALQGGQNALSVFSNIATSMLQRVLDKMLEMAVITPILNSLTGGVGGGLLSGLTGLFGFKNGGAFQNGKVLPFAKGGVVNTPTLFPMANGGTGLMGEAGAEAVMPLRRMSNGRLGVEADNNNCAVINIYNQSNSQIETRQRNDGTTDIIVKRVNEALMNERTSSGFRSAYNREHNKGIQAV